MLPPLCIAPRWRLPENCASLHPGPQCLARSHAVDAAAAEALLQAAACAATTLRSSANPVPLLRHVVDPATSTSTVPGRHATQPPAAGQPCEVCTCAPTLRSLRSPLPPTGHSHCAHLCAHARLLMPATCRLAAGSPLLLDRFADTSPRCGAEAPRHHTAHARCVPVRCQPTRIRALMPTWDSGRAGAGTREALIAMAVSAL